MSDRNNTIKLSKGLISLVNNLESTSYGSNVVSNIVIEGYGEGAVAFEGLKSDLAISEFSKFLEDAPFPSKIKALKDEIIDLEKKLSTLSTVFGDNAEANEGTLAFALLKKIETEIDELKNKRTLLETASDKAGAEYAAKLEDIDKKTKESLAASNKMVTEAQYEANRNVKLIEKFSDFLSETNKNMWLYSLAIVLIIISAAIAIYYSIPELLLCVKSYNSFVTNLGTKAQPWQIINYALGILIVKLPWALCLSALFTGVYSLLKGLLNTYEKINQDKRNMSAIYSVSGNVAQALNEYGLAIADEVDDPEDGRITYTITRSKAELERKRESLKWNQIINYFERMQSHKVEEPKDEDENSKLKIVTDILNKVIDKVPTNK